MSIQNSPVFRIIIAVGLGLLVFGASFSLSAMASLSDIFITRNWIAPLIYHVFLFIFSALLILTFSRGKPSKFGIKKPKSFPIFSQMLNAVIIGAIAGFIIYTFNSEELHPNASYKLWQKIIFIWIVSSICEELLVSGFIQSYMMPAKKYGVKILNIFFSIPVIISGIIFSILYIPLHLGNFILSNKISAFSFVLFSFVLLGISKAYFREKTESIIPPIFIHLVFNIALFYMIVLLK